MIKPFSYIVLLALFFSCSTDFPIRKFDGTTVLNYGPASKIKHYYDHRNLGENLEISIRPEKESYFPMEEMVVLITVKNISQRDSLRVYSPFAQIYFENVDGKTFFDSQYYSRCHLSVVRLARQNDVLNRPVKDVVFPRTVLLPGDSLIKRLSIRLSPRNRLFGELASKAFGFPGSIPAGSYYPRFKHQHREFTLNRLPHDTMIPLSKSLPLRVVMPTGEAKEKTDCILAMAETVHALGGLIPADKLGLQELHSLKNECEQLLQMEPVELYADLVHNMYVYFESSIRLYGLN